MRRIAYPLIALLLIQSLLVKSTSIEFNQASKEFVLASHCGLINLASYKNSFEGLKDGVDFQVLFKNWNDPFRLFQLKRRFFSTQKVIFHNAYDYVFSGISPPHTNT